MSRDLGFKFQKFLFFTKLIFNFRKSYQIWGKLAQEQKRYRQHNDPQLMVEQLPGSVRIKGVA